MPVKRPTVVSLAELEQAARAASLLVLDERQLTEVSGGIITTIIKTDPGTTLGMMPPRDPDGGFGLLVS